MHVYKKRMKSMKRGKVLLILMDGKSEKYKLKEKLWLKNQKLQKKLKDKH